MSVFKPRNIKASSVRIGDTISVTHKLKDVRVQVVGVVAKRDRRFTETTIETASGHVLLTEHADMTCTPRGARITLLVPAPSWQPTLEGFDNDTPPAA